MSKTILAVLAALMITLIRYCPELRDF